MSALIVASISAGMAVLALGLGIVQEVRHRQESSQPLELDIRNLWIAKNGDRIELVIVDVIAFNPSLLGVAINHLVLRAPAHPSAVFGLARPQRLIGGGWKLDAISYDKRFEATGEFDLPYEVTPMNVPPRQAEGRIFAFIPIVQPDTLQDADLLLVARLSSRRKSSIGFLGWRWLLGRRRTSYDEAQAMWHPDYVNSTDVPRAHLTEK